MKGLRSLNEWQISSPYDGQYRRLAFNHQRSNVAASRNAQLLKKTVRPSFMFSANLR
jgi:hypothetical protein